MGRGVEKLIRGILAAGTLWRAEVQAEPKRVTDEQVEVDEKIHKPTKLDRQTMPALEPRLFRGIAPEKRLAFANAAVDFLATEIPGATGVAEKFAALSPEEQGRAAQQVFEVTRLVATLIRNDLIKLVPLNEDQTKSLHELSQQLQFGEIGRYTTLKKWTAKLKAQPGGEDKLYAIWHQASELLHENFVASEKAPAPREKEPVPEPREEKVSPMLASADRTQLPSWIQDKPSEAAVRQPAAPAVAETAENNREQPVVRVIKKEAEKKLPKGAFGWDVRGQPFGWGFQNTYQYLKPGEELDEANLGPAFEGRSTSGKKTHGLRLPKDAYATWVRWGEDFDKTQHQELEAVEASRTYTKQAALRKKLGAWAAVPGFSEHHVAAVDIFKANRVSRYKALVEYDEMKNNPNHLPTGVQWGWVPTVKKEPWHWRHVGAEAAKAYWLTYGKEIIKVHLQYLRAD
ncbi:MAG TPA: hypothetical protein VJA27_03040 [Patescibacteria group bacterium]|nr:hypothetical protein [Patescibacteria group bacterium]